MTAFRRLLAIGIALLWCHATIEANAQGTRVLHKLLAEDADRSDDFGIAVAIDGATALVGARWDDDNGGSSGSAYTFDSSTGDQIVKLTPDDGAELDLFGSAVAIDAGVALVGAESDDDAGAQSGSAYLFNASTGQQLFKLTPDDGAPGDFFGGSVDIDGGVAVVGAVGNDADGRGAGAAYLFDATSGAQLRRLRPNDAEAGIDFGRSVAIDGDLVLVGAAEDNDNGTDSGSAYLFDATTGAQIAKLTPNDGAAFMGFGYSVALDDGVALIGAWDSDNQPNDSFAYLFDLTDRSQIAKLTATGDDPVDTFGYSVAIDGGVALVGARGEELEGFNEGAAYRFDATTGAAMGKVVAPDRGNGDQLGYGVAISGDRFLIGAPGDDEATTNAGSAYVFTVVPEPTAAVLILLASSLLARRSRR